MRRTRAAVASIVVAASLTIGALLVATWPRPLPQLVPAGESAELRLSAGPSLHLNADRPNDPLTSCALAAHPADPDRLFAVAALSTAKGAGVVGYASNDGGATWAPACERLPAVAGERLGDPTVAFGPGGELYLAHAHSFGTGTGALPPG